MQPARVPHKPNGTSHQDRGYAWVVLVACFLLNNIKAGNFLVGIFLVEFQQNLSVSRVSVAWVGGLHMFVGPVCGIFLGPVMKRCGVRVTVILGSVLIGLGFLLPVFASDIIVVYIFIGIFASTGYVLTTNATVLVIQQYFSRRRALANGLYMTGFSTGMLALPPILRLTMDSYGWRAGLVAMAAIAMQGIALGALLRPISATIAIEPPKTALRQRQWHAICKLLQCVPYILYLLTEFGITIGFRTVLLYTPMRCDMIGMPKGETAWLMSTIGLCGLVAYPVFGWLADQPWVDGILLYGAGGVVSGVAIIVTGTLYDFGALLAGMVVLSTFIVTAAGSMGPVVRAIVGVDQLEIALGIRTTVVGISNIIFNITSGYLFDYTGNPNVPFYVFGAMQAVCGFIPAIISYMKRRDADNNEASVAIS